MGAGGSSNAAHTKSAVWRQYRSVTEAWEQVFRKSLLDLLSALGDFFPSACSPLSRLGPGEDHVWVGSRMHCADFLLCTRKRSVVRFRSACLVGVREFLHAMGTVPDQVAQEDEGTHFRSRIHDRSFRSSRATVHPGVLGSGHNTRF